ncbi:MAG: twin-arginine translocation signal domain-containing protein, partial [Xanthobacteraceae bacterium]
MIHRRSFLKLSAAGVIGAGASPAFAQQDYPSRPIRVL